MINNYAISYLTVEDRVAKMPFVDWHGIIKNGAIRLTQKSGRRQKRLSMKKEEPRDQFALSSSRDSLPNQLSCPPDLLNLQSISYGT